MFRRLSGLCLALLWSITSPASLAATVHAAVASNFAATARVLAAAFEQNSGYKVLISTGSSGKLYAQIQHGAPYDVLLSADEARPRRLEAHGHGVTGTRFTYATGILVLWSPRPDGVDNQGEVLRRADFRRLAIANPKIAPYGQAASQALRAMQLWDGLAPRLVYGENIAQTHQFVASGNAELGLVAYAQVKTDTRGSMWRVPAGLYAPIAQQAVLLKRGAGNPAAKDFLDFLRSAPARAIIDHAGYGIVHPYNS